MSLLNLYDLVDDIHEFCYVLSHVLQLHELLNFSLEKVAVLRERVTDKIKLLHRRNTLTDKKTEDIPSSSQTASRHACSEDHKELKCRILALEKEMAELRRQISQMPPGPLQSHLKSCNLPVIPEIKVETVIPPPPPPPPPLPPTARISVGTSTFQKKKSRKNGYSQNQSLRSSQHLDMATVLSGLKDVKLRRTEKSPGGTPLRRLAIYNSNDPGDFLKVALRKRFETIHPNDSENKENRENTDDSWEMSPNRSFTA